MELLYIEVSSVPLYWLSAKSPLSQMWTVTIVLNMQLQFLYF